MRLLRTAFFLAIALLTFSSAYAQHSLQVDDGAGHNSIIVAPTAPTTFKLPSNTGTAGQALINDGTGNTSWQPATGFTASFGYWYNNFPFPVFILPGGSALNQPIWNTGVNIGTAFTFNGPNITINETGTYQVDFSITIGQFQPNSGQFAISINGVAANGTRYTCQPGTATQGMAYLNLNAGDVLDLVNSGFQNVNMGFPFFFNSNCFSLRLARIQ
jgi:hypothetical protein